jgi:hypothetical protein
MSTPIAQLPKGSTTAPPDDPEVLNVLQELEQEVQTATKAHTAPPPMMAPAPHTMMMPAPSIQVKKVEKTWINQEMLHHALIVGLVAIVAFYPKTLEKLYTTFPKLEFLQPFDLLIRGALVVVVVYVLALQFGL